VNFVVVALEAAERTEETLPGPAMLRTLAGSGVDNPWQTRLVV
jgi:hypothetical protein